MRRGLNTRCGKYAFLYFCLSFFLWDVAAQTNEIQLTVLSVSDSTPVAGAFVYVRDKNGKALQSKMTRNDGTLSIPFSGNLQLDIRQVSFQPFTQTITTAENITLFLTPKQNQLQDVMVTAQSAPSPVSGSVYDVTLLSAEEIRQKGANNLREALQNTVNIDLSQDPIFGSTLSLNGISGEGVKFLVDGAPLTGRVDGKIDLTQIPVNNIERIEIVKGPMGVQYGSDAIGGVINIITRANAEQGWEIGAKGFYESVGQYNTEVFGQWSKGKTTFFGSAGRYFFNGFTDKDTFQRFEEWKPREQYFADIKLKSRGSRWTNTFSAALFRETLINRSEPRLGLDFGSDTAWTYKGDDLHFSTWRIRATELFSYSFDGKDKWENQLSYSGFIRTILPKEKDLVSGTEVPATDPGSRDSTQYHLLNWRSIYYRDFFRGALSTQFGTDILAEFTQQNRVEGKTKDARDYAAFASLVYKPIRWMSIQPAFRAGYNERINRGYVLPSLHFRIEPHPKVQLRFGYGRGMRVPSLKELYLTFFDINHSLQGNPALSPEKSNLFQFSLQHTAIDNKVKLQWQASVFYNQVFDKIDFGIIPGQGPELDTLRYTNLKNYRVIGPSAGFSLQWKMIRLQADALYGIYSVNTQESASSAIRQLSPDISATLRVLIPYLFCHVTTQYKYTGPKLLYAVNNSIQSGVRNAFHSLDVTLSRSFWKDRVELAAGGKNLLNVRNVGASGVIAGGHNFNGNEMNTLWGRTVFVSFTIRYGEKKKSE